VYVSDYDSDSLTLLSPTFRVTTYNVTFKETGLPSGTYWWARLDGSGITGTARTIEFREPNGTLQPYAVAQLSGYSASRQFGTVHVDGKNLAVTVAYTPLDVRASSSVPAGVRAGAGIHPSPLAGRSSGSQRRSRSSR